MFIRNHTISNYHFQSPRFQFYYNIGECEYLRNRYDLALEAFETYLEKGGEKISAEDRAHAEHVIQESAAIIGRLNVTGEGTFEIWVDGEDRGKTPLSGLIPLMPGKHTVAFMINGNTIGEQAVSIGEGATVEVTIPKNRNASVPIQPPAQPDAKDAELKSNSFQKKPVDGGTEIQKSDSVSTERRKSPMMTTGFILAGIGGATIAASLVTGKLALSKANRLEDNCDGQKDCDESNKNLHDRAASLAIATNILLTTGSALAITGVVMAIVGHRKSTSNEKLAVQTTPLLGQSLMGIVIQGSF